MNTIQSGTTLVFDHHGMEWTLSNPTWQHEIAFLTHDAAMDYVKRNGITLAHDSSVAPVAVYQVVDRHTNKVVGQYSTRNAASRRRDKLDNEYGAYRYQVRSVTL